MRLFIGSNSGIKGQKANIIIIEPFCYKLMSNYRLLKHLVHGDIEGEETLEFLVCVCVYNSF